MLPRADLEPVQSNVGVDESGGAIAGASAMEEAGMEGAGVAEGKDGRCFAPWVMARWINPWNNLIMSEAF
jgi:hypothetical protein